jgi:ABC-type Zn uptake system ZnuABC Zn-binding protein ZnuA
MGGDSERNSGVGLGYRFGMINWVRIGWVALSRKRLEGIALCWLGLIAAGCDKAPSPMPVYQKIRVVATAYPLADIARQVGGDAVQCDWLAEQGQTVDLSDPTDDDRQRIRQAEMVLTNGTGEDWAGAGSEDPTRGRMILRVDVLPAAKVDTGSRALWLDPEVAKNIATDFARRLGAQRPEQANLFNANADRFATSVDQLMNEFSSRIAAIQGRKVLVLSHNFVALTRVVGLVEVRATDDASPLQLSDEQMRALRDAIQSQGAEALLVSVGTPPAVQQDLSQRLGVPVILLDSLGTSAGVGRNTYQAILRYDLEQLTGLAKH